MESSPLIIKETQLDTEEEIQAYLKLTAAYMADEMGGGTPWTTAEKEKVITDLQKHPSKLILLASINREFVGVCTCFIGYSTFLSGGLINIHDIFVLKEYRGKAIGRKLLKKVSQIAKERGYRKVTLEVRNDNHNAQGLYQSEGFKDGTPPMLFWSKLL